MATQGMGRKGPISRAGMAGGGPAAASGFAHPFQGVLDVSGGTQIVRFNRSSRVYETIGTVGTSPVGSGFPETFTLTSNLHVWLEATVSGSLTVSAFSGLQSGTSWPELVVLSGGAQTHFRVPIGRVTTPAVAPVSDKPGFGFSLGGVAYWWEQCLFSHLLVEARYDSGLGAPIIYGFPFGGAA